MLQGHLVGSLLPIPEVEGKEGSRYPRHRWTFSFSVMCYFQIRRRTLLTGYFNPKKERRRLVTPSAHRIIFRTFRIFRIAE